MTHPPCRLCPTPAYWSFREGHLLCAECAAEIFKLCEISGSPTHPGERATADVKVGTPASVVAANSSPSETSSPDVSAPAVVRELANLRTVVGASFEEGIPSFLQRDADNIPGYARGE